MEIEDVLRGIHRTVLDAGPKQLANRMCVGHVSLLNRTNPNDDSHHLQAVQWIQILRMTGDVRSLQALAGVLGYNGNKRYIRVNYVGTSGTNAIVTTVGRLGRPHVAPTTYIGTAVAAT
jgi:hypothetical protein